MNTRTFTFYLESGDKLGIEAISVVVEQGVYKVLGIQKGVKGTKSEVLACFPLTAYYTSNIIG